MPGTALPQPYHRIPVVRARYEFEAVGEPALPTVLDDWARGQGL